MMKMCNVKSLISMRLNSPYTTSIGNGTSFLNTSFARVDPHRLIVDFESGETALKVDIVFCLVRVKLERQSTTHNQLFKQLLNRHFFARAHFGVLNMTKV